MTGRGAEFHRLDSVSARVSFARMFFAASDRNVRMFLLQRGLSFGAVTLLLAGCLKLEAPLR